MLLLLPKEILQYILSIVICETCAQAYDLEDCSKTEFIEKYLKTWHFYRVYKYSEMTPLMRELSLIHPRIRKILVAAHGFDKTRLVRHMVIRSTFFFDGRCFLEHCFKRKSRISYNVAPLKKTLVRFKTMGRRKPKR